MSARSARARPVPAECAEAFAGQLAPALLGWWEQHGRKDLPWQRSPTAYRVWVSEIMLQQTQVATVARYYDRFLDAFPGVRELADAPLDQVLHLWSGLGYYARARNLHRAAGIVRDEHAGELPQAFDALAALPGIGRSTAGAILALSADQRFPILDGNVKRVLARVFRVEGWPGDAAVARRLWALAEACTPTVRVAHYTQAIMDLGASLCGRRNPACGLCPLQAGCQAAQAGVAQALPGKRPPRARPQRQSVIMLIRDPDGAVLLERRPAAGLWGGLWGFPEASGPEAVAGWCAAQFGVTPARLQVRPALHHGFTHFDLEMTPVEACLPRRPARALEGTRWLWYKTREPAAVGLAAPVSRLLAALGEEAWPAQ